MSRSVRAGFAAAFLAIAFASAMAAEKPFKQSALDDAAIKLEAQIKSDAGSVSKPAAALRRDADAAFQKNDLRGGMLVLGQLVTVAPDDASGWLRLARTILQIKPRDDREKALLLDRASTAAYVAYQRAGDRNSEADSLSVLGKALADRQQWRGALNSLRLSLELRETADLRGQYEKLREEHGFRLLDYHHRLRFGFAANVFPVLRGRFPAGAPTSRRSSSSRGWTGLQSRRARSSFASRASSTASATR